MPRDGSGNYTRSDGTRTGNTVWEQNRQAGVLVNTEEHDQHDQDIAQALTDSLAKDGQTVPTANLPMGAKKHTGVADADANDQYAAWGQVLGLVTPFVPAANVGGTGDAITLTPSSPITAYEVGKGYRFFVQNANTASPTLAVSGLAAVSLRRSNGSEMTSGDLAAGRHLIAIYNGSHFRTNVEPAAEAGGLSQAQVDARVVAGVLEQARTGNTDAWPADKIPNLDADKINAGVLNINRIPDIPASKLDTSGASQLAPVLLGTGTPDNTKYLRGDGAWADFPFDPDDYSGYVYASSGSPAYIGGIYTTQAAPNIRVTFTSVPVALYSIRLIANDGTSTVMQVSNLSITEDVTTGGSGFWIIVLSNAPVPTLSAIA